MIHLWVPICTAAPRAKSAFSLPLMNFLAEVCNVEFLSLGLGVEPTRSWEKVLSRMFPSAEAFPDGGLANSTLQMIEAHK